MTEECVICLENVKDDTYTHLNGCKKIFHNKCIKEWSNTSKNCPICRMELESINEDSELELYMNQLSLTKNKRRKIKTPSQIGLDFRYPDFRIRTIRRNRKSSL